ncbi:MAG: carbon-nitrogen hydrolase family protein [Bryobacteraceae bacterium]
MRVVIASLLTAFLLPAAQFEADSTWKTWAPRDEIAPRAWKDTNTFRTAPPSLAISGASNQAAAGGWQRDVAGIETGKWYRLKAYFRSAAVAHENLQVLARIDWRRADGKRAGQPEYGWRIRGAGEWKEVTIEAPAPEKVSAARIQLHLQNSPQGAVWFDDLSFESIPAPAARKVHVASVNLWPKQTGAREESVRQFYEYVRANVADGVDVILLPEGITVVGTGKSYAEVAETIPGPTTEQLAELARAKNAWVVAGIYEREEQAMYNTAVLIDRKGNVAGRYRKVYLPREEIEGGLTPGSDYPVFATDFGKVGVMICWDLQYADPARHLALRGAELLLVPIWGGNETLGKARAIENRVFIATSGYDYPTYVMDPDGEILALARENGSTATATIDLARRYADPWLGDMRGRFFKELRTDLE